MNVSEEIEVITVTDYVTNESLRETANLFLSTYGYEPKEVGEIRFSDKEISFCVRDEPGQPFRWVSHERF